MNNKIFIGTLLLILGIALHGYKLGMRHKAYIPYQALAIASLLSQSLLGQLQFDILTYIDVKVAISSADADLIV